MVDRNRGRVLRWTDEEIVKAIKEVYKKHGRVGSALLKKEFPGGYNAIYRRWLSKGKFKSMKETLDKVIEREELLERFRNLTLFQAAGWITDIVLTIIQKKPKFTANLEYLNILVEGEPERVRETLQEICRPCYPAARGIIEKFKKTKKGEMLLIF